MVSSLHSHMNKFHLINPNGSGTDGKVADSTTIKKIEDFVRATNKVLIFKDIKSYTDKIKNALSR